MTPRQDFIRYRDSGRTLLAVCCGVLAALTGGAASTSAAELHKDLVLPGQVFTVAGKLAFIFEPPAEAEPTATSKPWILYAPTLPNCPDEAERWMHERFTEAGVAVVGIDSG